MDTSLTQYIDLYLGHKATVEGNAPAALNAGRDKALETLRRLGRFPCRGDEGFVKTSLEDMFAPDYGVNIARVGFPVDAAAEFSCDIPNVGTVSSLMVNDTYVPVTPDSALPDGVEVMSLAKAAELYPEMVTGAPMVEDNAVAALNSLFVQDGAFIHISKNVAVERPIQILSLFNTSAPLMAARRVVIALEDGAEATVLLCNHPRVEGVDYLSCRMVQVSLGKAARLEFYDLEEATPTCDRASVFVSEQQPDSYLNVVSISLSGGRSRGEFYIRHLGEGCESSVNGMVIAGGKQVVDNATFVRHDHPHCTSSQLFKYSLFDEAEGAFNGMVTVDEGAVFTDARQTNRNLLASSGASMHAEPQLVINCDEVKASHGATTGQLDDNALFYMRARGIPENEARMMLINAFMGEVLELISHAPLRERLRHLVDKRLRGCAIVCPNCSLESLRRK